MQNAVRGRAQQQGEAVTTVTADDDQIYFFGFSHTLYLALRAAENQILPFGWDLQRRRKLGEVRFCLIVDLFLHRRQIHRDISTVGQRKRLNDVH